MPSLFPRRRLLFPRMSGPARLAAVLWLLTAIAVGAILIVATLRPAAANPLDIIAPAGQPVGQLVALAAITGAAVIGCVGAVLFVGAGGHPRRRRI
jgi:hypothetical protein